MKKFFKKLFKLLVLAGLIVLLLYLLRGLGFGLGSGDQGQAGDQNQTTQAEPSPQPQEPEPAGAAAEVSVLENEYIYENQRVTLDQLAEILAGMEGDVTVRVTDDNASLNAYNALLEKLGELDIPFVEMP